MVVFAKLTDCFLNLILLLFCINETCFDFLKGVKIIIICVRDYISIRFNYIDQPAASVLNETIKKKTEKWQSLGLSVAAI